MSNRKALSRRQFIGACGAGAAALGVGGCAEELPVPDGPLRPPELPDDLNLRLLARTTFGPTASEIAEIERDGYDAWLERQLDPQAIDDDVVEPYLRPLRSLDAAPSTLAESDEAEAVAAELIEARVYRAVFSKRQLFERLVDFWTDHFNIYQMEEATQLLKTVDDRDVIRSHALGSFADLLRASMTSPAMMVYLDNATNVAGAPNENYSRELLELHTLSPAAGYTQRDVEELSRALTGWGVIDDGPRIGTFVFRPELHDDGAKRIMDLELPAGGGFDDAGLIVDYLAGHPSTARFIATKLVRHFIADSAPQGVVDRVATAFSDSGGDIRTVMRALLSRESLIQAEPKLKRPFHYVIEIIRRTNVAMTRDTEDFGFMMQLLGHVPFRWPAPNGYPDHPNFWSPGLLARWNVAAALTYGEFPAAEVDPLAIAEGQGAFTTEDIIDLWNDMFFAGTMPADERQALIDYVDAEPEDYARMFFESFHLAISTASFQWY